MDFEHTLLHTRAFDFSLTGLIKKNAYIWVKIMDETTWRKQ